MVDWLMVFEQLWALLCPSHCGMLRFRVDCIELFVFLVLSAVLLNLVTLWWLILSVYFWVCGFTQPNVTSVCVAHRINDPFPP